MATFVVMEPAAGDAPRRAEEAVFVRDGFSFLAFLAPAVWLLWHRLWIEAGLALAATLALALFGSMSGLGGAPLLSILVGLFFGLEANGLRVAALRRRGWREWGALDARNVRDAELRYLAALETEGPRDRMPLPATEASEKPVKIGPPRLALGLFDYPGAR